MNILAAALLVALTAAAPPFGGGPTYTVPVAAESPLPPPQARPRMPALSFADGRGVPLNLSRYRGRVVLVSLWATTCAPCIKQMAALDSLQRDLGPGGFEVVALAQDPGGADTVRRFFAQQKLSSLKVFVDSGNEAGRRLGARGMPTSVLVDVRGRAVARLEGPVDWTAPEMMSLIRTLMAGG